MQPRVTKERMKTVKSVKYITRSKQNGEEHFLFSSEVYNPQLDDSFESRFTIIVDKNEMVSINVEPGYNAPEFSDVVKALEKMLTILKKTAREKQYGSVQTYKENFNVVRVGTGGNWIVKTSNGKMSLTAVPLETVQNCLPELKKI